MDPYTLYELCVTSPSRLAQFLEAVHGRSPKVLREDFSGSGALARAWPQVVKGGRAIAVDQDPEPLARCAKVPSVRPIVADVLACRERADIIAATNFAIGYWHTRAALLAYLRHTRSLLKRSGVFIADIYGGANAFTTGRTTRQLRAATGERVTYTWEQQEASPVTSRVLNAIHFRIQPKRGKPCTLRNAFTYDWRLWSIPELKDTMIEAGFKATEVHDRLGGAIDHTGQLHTSPLADDEPLDKNYVVYVVGRT